jgi:ABC-type phosphate transport system substrate-binding protein
MNSVLKTYLQSVTNPSWEDGECGTVLVCYARYISPSGEVTTEQFKDKTYFKSAYEKHRDMFLEVRCFLAKMDIRSKGVVSKYQNYKIIASYIAFAYREAAKGQQYLSDSYVEYDARLDPDDRLGFFATVIGGRRNHE